MAKRLFSYLTLITFLFTNFFYPSPVSFAQTATIQRGESGERLLHSPKGFTVSPDTPADLSLPPRLGAVEEIYRDPQAKEQVILIQDAHAIPDAQRSIRKILAYLQSSSGLRLIALEGTSGKLDPTLLRNFPKQPWLRRVLAQSLDYGELSGAAAASILNKEEADYYGVENQDLYEKAIDAFLEALKSRDELSAGLKSLSAGLGDLKKKYYSHELFELDQKTGALAGETFDLLGAVRYLEKHLKQGTSAGMASKYPHVDAVMKEISRRPLTDSASLNREVKALAQRLKTAIHSRRALKEFNLRLQDYETEKISLFAFVYYLDGFARGMHQSFGMSDGLKEAVKTYELIDQMKGKQFFEELDRWTGEIKGTLIRNADEKYLDLLDRESRILEKLAALKLTREEWKAFKEMQGLEVESFSGSADVKKLAGMFNDSIERIRTDHAAFLRFYETARNRDMVLTGNLLALMRRNKTKTAAFVTGGFHTDGVKEVLKQNHIAYTLISPRMKVVPHDDRYLDLMQGRVSWSRDFKVHNGRIDLYEAFARAVTRSLVEASALNDGRSSSVGLVLRQWRDQVIKSLNAENRIARAGQYTRFIDEAVKKTNDPDRLKNIKNEWLAKIDRFIEKLRLLKNDNHLTADGIMKLAGSMTATPAATIPWGSMPERWYVPVMTASGETQEPRKRSEARVSTTNLLERMHFIAEGVNHLWPHTVLRAPEGKQVEVEAYDAEIMSPEEAHAEHPRNMIQAALDYLDKKAVTGGALCPIMENRIYKLKNHSIILGSTAPFLFFYSRRFPRQIRKTRSSFRLEGINLLNGWLNELKTTDETDVAVLAAELYKRQLLIDIFFNMHAADKPIREIYQEVRRVRDQVDFEAREIILSGISPEVIHAKENAWMAKDMEAKAREKKVIRKEEAAVIEKAAYIERAAKRAAENNQYDTLYLMRAEIGDVAHSLGKLAHHYDSAGQSEMAVKYHRRTLRMYHFIQQIDQSGYLPVQLHREILYSLLRAGLWDEFLQEYHALLTGKAFTSPDSPSYVRNSRARRQVEDFRQRWLGDWLKKDVPSFLFKLEDFYALCAGDTEKQARIAEIQQVVEKDYKIFLKTKTYYHSYENFEQAQSDRSGNFGQFLGTLGLEEQDHIPVPGGFISSAETIRQITGAFVEHWGRTNGQSRELILYMRRTNDKIEIFFEDNGQGIDLEQISLETMQEPVAAVSGNFTVVDALRLFQQAGLGIVEILSNSAMGARYLRSSKGERVSKILRHTPVEPGTRIRIVIPVRQAENQYAIDLERGATEIIPFELSREVKLPRRSEARTALDDQARKAELDKAIDQIVPRYFGTGTSENKAAEELKTLLKKSVYPLKAGSNYGDVIKNWVTAKIRLPGFSAPNYAILLTFPAALGFLVLAVINSSWLTAVGAALSLFVGLGWYRNFLKLKNSLAKISQGQNQDRVVRIMNLGRPDQVFIVGPGFRADEAIMAVIPYFAPFAKRNPGQRDELFQNALVWLAHMWRSYSENSDNRERLGLVFDQVQSPKIMLPVNEAAFYSGIDLLRTGNRIDAGFFEFIAQYAKEELGGTLHDQAGGHFYRPEMYTDFTHALTGRKSLEPGILAGTAFEMASRLAREQGDGIEKAFELAPRFLRYFKMLSDLNIVYDEDLLLNNLRSASRAEARLDDQTASPSPAADQEMQSAMELLDKMRRNLDPQLALADRLFSIGSRKVQQGQAFDEVEWQAFRNLTEVYQRVTGESETWFSSHPEIYTPMIGKTAILVTSEGLANGKQLREDLDYEDWLRDRGVDMNNPLAVAEAMIGYEDEVVMGNKVDNSEGGLGALAGDEIRELGRELKRPSALTPEEEKKMANILGVGLFYRDGIFVPKVNERGHQSFGTFTFHKKEELTAIETLQKDGEDVILEIPYHDGTRKRIIRAKVEIIQIGKIKFALINPDIAENDQDLRNLAPHPYPDQPGFYKRFLNEWLLGVGAVKLIEACGLTPGALHLNETATIFSIMALIQYYRESYRKKFGSQHSLSFDEARQLVRNHVVFTTHTLEAVALERFHLGYTPIEASLVALFGGEKDAEAKDFARKLVAEATEYERAFPLRWAIAFSKRGRRNAVSKLNADTAETQIAYFLPPGETQIGSLEAVTNGVDWYYWLAKEYQKRLTKEGGRELDSDKLLGLLDPNDPDHQDLWKWIHGTQELPPNWGQVPRSIPDEEIQATSLKMKKRLIGLLRSRMARNIKENITRLKRKIAEKRENPGDEERLTKLEQKLARIPQLFSLDRPIITWARRVVPYKRMPHVLLGDKIDIAQARIDATVKWIGAETSSQIVRKEGESDENFRFRLEREFNVKIEQSLDDMINQYIQSGYFNEFLKLITEKKAQFIFSGRAHPENRNGRAEIYFLSRVVEILGLSHPEIENSVVFVPEYGAEIAQAFAQGSDISLATPEPPKEASGTSPEKFMQNGKKVIHTRDGFAKDGIFTKKDASGREFGVNGRLFGPSRQTRSYDWEAYLAEEAVDMYAKLHETIDDVTSPDQTRNLRMARAAMYTGLSLFTMERVERGGAFVPDTTALGGQVQKGYLQMYSEASRDRDGHLYQLLFGKTMESDKPVVTTDRQGVTKKMKVKLNFSIDRIQPPNMRYYVRWRMAGGEWTVVHAAAIWDERNNVIKLQAEFKLPETIPEHNLVQYTVIAVPDGVAVVDTPIKTWCPHAIWSERIFNHKLRPEDVNISQTSDQQVLEIDARTFHPEEEGPMFDKLTTVRLQDLEAAGSNNLYLLGVWTPAANLPHQNEPGHVPSAFAIPDYDVNPAFGGAEGLRNLSRRAKRTGAGIRLTLDYVPYYLAKESPLIIQRVEDGVPVVIPENLKMVLYRRDEPPAQSQHLYFKCKNPDGSPVWLAYGRDGNTWPDTVVLNLMSPRVWQFLENRALRIAELTGSGGMQVNSLQALHAGNWWNTWQEDLKRLGIKNYEEYQARLKKVSLQAFGQVPVNTDTPFEVLFNNVKTAYPDFKIMGAVNRGLHEYWQDAGVNLTNADYVYEWLVKGIDNGKSVDGWQEFKDYIFARGRHNRITLSYMLRSVYFLEHSAHSRVLRALQEREHAGAISPDIIGMSKVLAAAIATIPGVPMFNLGQERGELLPLPGADFIPPNPPSSEQATIIQGLEDFYRWLFKTTRQPEFRYGGMCKEIPHWTQDGRKEKYILAFTRQHGNRVAVVVLNHSNFDREITLDLEHLGLGLWEWKGDQRLKPWEIRIQVLDRSEGRAEAGIKRSELRTVADEMLTSLISKNNVNLSEARKLAALDERNFDTVLSLMRQRAPQIVDSHLLRQTADWDDYAVTERAFADFTAEASLDAVESMMRRYLDSSEEHGLSFAWAMPFSGDLKIQAWMRGFLNRIHKISGEAAYGKKISAKVAVLISEKQKSKWQAFRAGLANPEMVQAIETGTPVQAAKDLNTFLSLQPNALIYAPPGGFEEKIHPAKRWRIVELEGLSWKEAFPVSTVINFRTAQEKSGIAPDLLKQLPEIFSEAIVAVQNGRLTILEVARRFRLENSVTRMLARMA